MNKKFLFKKKGKAFSLIELSIVLVVIGIAISSITQSSRLIAQFKLSSARSQTQSSPVTSIKDLSMWLETTTVDSFSENESEDGSGVSVWKDINNYSSAKVNGQQSSSFRYPQYKTNCINGLPCLRFDGSSDYFDIDASFLAGTDYTIFVVEQRRSPASQNFFIAGTNESGGSNCLLHLGYRENNYVTFAQYFNDYDYYVDGYQNISIPRIHTFMLSQLTSSSGRYYYLNGVLQAYVAVHGYSPNAFTPLDSFIGATIGYYSNSGNSKYYNGDLGEIIIFNRSLKAEERISVENYLGKKWSIKL